MKNIVRLFNETPSTAETGPIQNALLVPFAVAFLLEGGD
jgi:hypothetical protein